jgi:hypothetical protein
MHQWASVRKPGDSGELDLMDNGHGVDQPNLESDRLPLPDRFLRLPAGWVLVAAIVLLQWGTFVQFADREITWAYPAHFDQTVFLGLSYQTFEHMLNQGLLAGLWQGLTAQVPQGNLLHVQAALLYLVRGPSRLSALTLNWLHLILLECAFVYILRWLSHRWSVAFIGLGLLLTTTARFAPAGGLMDFRTDFSAFCLYGIILCVVVRSGVFKSFRWSVAVGISIAWTILFRHLTTLSIAFILFCVLVLAGLRAFSQRRNPAGKDEWTNRIKGVIISGLSVLLLAAPMIWTMRETILRYYGQILTTDEGRLRAEEFHVSRTADFLLFYPRSLLSDHLGKTCIAAVALILAVTLPVLARTSRKTWRALPALSVDPGVALFFLGTALIVPLTVLSAFPARSPVVGSFLVPPVIGGVLAMVVAFGRVGHERASTTVLLVCLSTIVLSAGIYTDLSMSSRKAMFAGGKDDVMQAGELYDEIGMRSTRYGWDTPRVAFDRVRDYLHPAILQPWFYERHGRLINPIALNNTILPATTDEALSAISACDFAVLTDPSSPEDPGFPYPFNQSMKQLYPTVRAAAEQQLVQIRHLEVFSQQLTLYMRVPLLLDGASGGWITSSGVVVRGPGELLLEHPTIELSGHTILFEHFGNSLHVRAQLMTSGQSAKEVPATITPPGPEYSLVIHLDKSDIRTDQEVRVKVLFDKYVVPKEVGFNDDPRQLVIMTPTQVRAIRK